MDLPTLKHMWHNITNSLWLNMPNLKVESYFVLKRRGNPIHLHVFWFMIPVVW